MKYFLASLFLTSLCLHGEADALGRAEVTLPYSELRALIAAGKKPAPAEPPIPSAILSSQYRLVPGEISASGTATFDVRTFHEGAQLVPLIAEGVVISQIEPPEASVVLKDGFYNLLVEGAKRQTVTLHIVCPGKPDGDTLSFQCGICPSAVSSLVLPPAAEGQSFDVRGAVKVSTSGKWNLGPQPALDIRVSRKSSAKAGTIVAMPAVVREAKSTMRIVSDGTFFNATSWKIRHNTAVIWRLTLGDETQVVSCLVDGQPFAPVDRGGSTIEIRLPESNAESTVELAYTGKSSPFAPVRGDLSVSLPSTDLLVERSEWELVLPSAYSPLAVEGNCEFFPGSSKNELVLRKELCRGESPSIRVFYQKPETTKKP
ncbi:MAG: hypothetical protein ACOYM3_16100 [Terrimicrobiaceae bacterium]